MSERENYDAGVEARRDITRPDRPWHHEDAVRVYLAGLAYAEAHRRQDRAEATPDEPTPPVRDEG